MEYTVIVCFEDASRRRFLMARNATRGWELPGGRVHDGEAPLEAALREFREEIGHDLSEARLALTQGRENGTCHVVSGIIGRKKDGHRPPDEKIVAWRFVEKLTAVHPLAFPNDPYEEIEAVLGVKLR